MMEEKPSNRRDFAKDILLFTAAGSVLENIAFGGESKASASSATNSVPIKEHKPKPLSFNPASLMGISEKLINSHWQNNYLGSVKTLNEVRHKLAEALATKDTPPFVYGDLKREHLLRNGSVVLHELYFDNLGGDGKSFGSVQEQIAQEFGSFEVWEQEFKMIAKSLAGGSGWVVLAYNYAMKQLENYWLWDHMHGPTGTIPLLVLDMYEHSYQMDYGAAAAKYIDVFFQNIQWNEVGTRWSNAKKLNWV